jgi:hypothetical protein
MTLRRKPELKEGECAYCGNRRELTRDHVPPRCLFSKPRPSDLVTVPCCGPCNRELSKHDEYFRIAITTGIDAAKFPKEFEDSLCAINNLKSPCSQGFARKLLQSYDANIPALTIDQERIGIVLRRITRGLFYHHTNNRLPERAAFEHFTAVASLEGNPIGRELIDRLEENPQTIGRGHFRYAFDCFDIYGHFVTFWLMRFYGDHTFFCITASNWRDSATWKPFECRVRRRVLTFLRKMQMK